MIKLVEEVVTKEVKETDIVDGTYYFSRGYIGDDPYIFKMVVIRNTDMDADICEITVQTTDDDYSISYREYDDFTLNYRLSPYFRGEKNDDGEEYRAITEEEFNKEKQQILKKL